MSKNKLSNSLTLSTHKSFKMTASCMYVVDVSRKDLLIVKYLKPLVYPLFIVKCGIQILTSGCQE